MSKQRDLSRAESVRLRRREQSQKRAAQSSVLATRPLPPVTSRNAPIYSGRAQATIPSTRRRYQTALSMPGVEVRMPSLQVTSAGLKSRLLSGFLSLLLGAALYCAATLPEFRAGTTQVTGNQRLSQEDINAVLNTSGQSIFTLVGSDLETRLRLNFPELAWARVSIGLPNLVAVEVVERQPVIAWQQGNGYTWIDQTGVAFRPRGAAPNLITVVAAGTPPHGTPAENDPLSPVPYMSPDLVKAIQILAPSVPQGAALVYDPANGLGWSDSRGWKVYFGTPGADGQDMALKLRVYQSLVNTLTQKGITPALISVQYPNAPYYRMSQ